MNLVAIEGDFHGSVALVSLQFTNLTGQPLTCTNLRLMQDGMHTLNVSIVSKNNKQN